MSYECENCKEVLPSDSDSEKVKVLNSGKAFSPDYGTYHWWELEIECPECDHINYISDQSA